MAKIDGTVLIFGGVGGIGEALARRLAADGAQVVVTARDLARAETLAREIGGVGLAVDCLDPGQIADAVQRAAAAGPLRGLAYCVGSIALKPLRRTDAEDVLDAFRLNTLGAILAIKAAEPALKAAQGSVVLFSTVAVAQGFPNHTAIAAAKGGVEAITRTLAAELAPDIRVNCIAPSLTATPLAQPLLANPAMADALGKMHPIPRLGMADDHASLAAFLLSPDAGWLTGQVIGVDGGRATLRPKG